MSGLQATVVRSFAELEGLERDWNALAASTAMPLLDHDWFACAARAFHAEADLRVVAVHRQGMLTAVAPLALEPSHRHLVVLGSHALFEPVGCLADSEDSLRALATAVVALGFPVIFDRMAAGAALAQFPRGQAVTIKRPAASSYAVLLNGTAPGGGESLSKKTRQRLEQYRARTEADFGTVVIEHCSPAPDRVDEYLALLTQVEASGWKGRDGSALALRPQLAKFFHLYAPRASARGRLRFTILRAGGDTAALEMSIDAYEKAWGLKLAYDERFAAYAPALQLVHRAIQRAAESGLAAYEFLGSAEEWQRRWKPVRRQYGLLALYPVNPRGMMTALRDATSAVARRVAGSTKQPHL